MNFSPLHSPYSKADTRSLSQSNRSLQALVLDLSKVESWSKLSPQVTDFIQRLVSLSGEVKQPTESPVGLLQRYLDQVWPDRLSATLYVSTISRDQSEPSHKRGLLLRPVSEGPRHTGAAVGAYALGFEVYRRQGKLVVFGVDLVPHVARRSFEAQVSAPLCWRSSSEYMTSEDLDWLQARPLKRAQTGRHLTNWKDYLKWKEKLVRANQLKVPYEGYRQPSEGIVEFLISRESSPDQQIIGMEFGFDSRTDTASRKNKSARFTPLGVIEKIYPCSSVPDQGTRPSKKKGKARGNSRGQVDYVWIAIDLASVKRSCHWVRPDPDHAKPDDFPQLQLPGQGELLSNISGDLGPLQNQLAGVERLEKSQSFCPHLADFLFDAGAAGAPIELPAFSETPGSQGLNPSQRSAVAKAIEAPDLCLIQGPPGTGKTTVIAELCLRAVRAGQRVLVASQTNLAVDNVLGRLPMCPELRPLRIGASDRVDDEFRQFLEDQVLGRWSTTVAKACREGLRAGIRIEEELQAYTEAMEQLRSSFQAYAAERAALARARDDIGMIEGELQQARQANREAESKTDQVTRRADLLDQLTRWARDEAVLPPMGEAEPWPSAVALPGELTLSQAPLLETLSDRRDRREPLRRASQALERLHKQAPTDIDAARELKDLQAEKGRLIDSDLEADMSRLREINQRLKSLKSSGWHQHTTKLGRAARQVWREGVPESVARIVDALKPSEETERARQEARSLIDLALAQGEQAAQLISESATHWAEEGARAEEERERMRGEQDEAEKLLRKIQARLEGARDRERAAQDEGRAQVKMWEAAWRQLRPEATNKAPSEAKIEAPSEAGLEEAARFLEEKRGEVSPRLERSQRWRGLQKEWLKRLGEQRDDDQEQLQSIYLRHANVVGMTCNEAGKRKTWQTADFKPFDLVIVDEVSKVTPPELILPLLLGKRSVLVGDHRQLPPMFREREASFEEAIERGEVKREDFERYRQMVTSGLFEALFEQAPETIKATLWMQYRMHPQIMRAVNQFYEEKLEAGPTPTRGHQLEILDLDGARFLTPGQNLLWIDTSRDQRGQTVWEEQHGSSKRNPLEVKVIVALLRRLGEALLKQGYGETQALLIPPLLGSQRWDKALQRLVPALSAETCAALFAAKRVRLNGRPLRADEQAQVGAKIELRAQKEVGVISFYGAQLRALREAIRRAQEETPAPFEALELRSNTVDRFQGMEKPIVIVSLVRAKRGQLGSFVREFQRINVGLSRAQELLAIVGAEETWRRAMVPLPPIDGGEPVDRPTYRHIIEIAQQEGGRRLARQLLP